MIAAMLRRLSAVAILLACTPPARSGRPEVVGGAASPQGAGPDASRRDAEAKSAALACPGRDPESLGRCVQQPRLVADLAQVTGKRPPGSRHWQRVQSHCAESLAAAGFDVRRDDYGTGVNVIGERRGRVHPEQRVVVGAHYDHIPGCAGADDNATGVAALLEIGRVLGTVPADRTLVLACWDEEERGLIGSRAYVDAIPPGTDTRVYFNFDTVGYTDDRPQTQRVPAGFGLLFPASLKRLAERGNRADFVAIIADAPARPHARRLARAAESLELPAALLTIPTVVKDSHVAIDLHRSDHASFWAAGVPAVMLTDTAEFRSDAYHCRGRADELSTLDEAFLTAVVRASVVAIASSLDADADADAPQAPAPAGPDGAAPGPADADAAAQAPPG